MVDVTPRDVATGRAAKDHQDFVDLQNEISGADTGRMRKFLSPDDDRTPEGKRKKAEREQTRRTLEDLMRDPEYARLYVEFGDRLGTAETGADTALAAIQQMLDAAQQDVSDMEVNAARDPDGRAVFQYVDGRVVYADGTDVDPDIAAGIIWPPNAPSAEEYFAAKDRVQSLQDSMRDWTTYRYDVLGDMRDRYDDKDNPMDKDDLRHDLDRIEKLRPELRELNAPPPSPEKPDTGLSALNVPMALN
ncbi:hypothetical protein [uncultured Tateyamaria sp.]|uniref:hypothetical protein n=1 Tax=uncultured Tateyamaria sp. TaxID=455651 RepID=UPI00262678B8|nr:hypothetical protein [uncultured Tateyamaria sp.]